MHPALEDPGQFQRTRKSRLIRGKRIPIKQAGGEQHAKTEMESEYDLHIRALTGEPAAHLPLRSDHRGRPHGLRKDHGSEPVSYTHLDVYKRQDTDDPE